MDGWDKPFTYSCRLVLVDRSTGAEAGVVEGLLRGGRVTRNADSAARESGRVTVAGRPSFGSRLVRLYADVEFGGGGKESVALGTFVPQVSRTDYDGAVATTPVELVGRLSELDGDAFDAPVTFPAGTPTVAAAASVAEAAGFRVHADQSTHVLSSPRTYGVDGGGKLEAVNDLLSLAGFSSAETDAMGALRMRRYVEPSGRPTVHRFTDGEGTRLLRDVTDELDVSEVPNVVHAVYETPETTVVGVAVDDDPASPWSVAARGYRKAKVYRYADSSSQADADARAASLLASSRSAVRRVTFRHTYVPISPGDVVSVEYASAGVSARVAVRVQDIDLGAGLVVECEGRAFVR